VAVTPLDEARRDLEAWLPIAAALIAQPDTQPSIGRTKPGSKPPWNSEVAAVLHETIGVLADIHLELAHAVHGRYLWDPAYRHAGRTLTAITRLAEACDQELVRQSADTITRRVTAIMQLPAVDLEEKPRRREGPCPECGRAMLRILPRSGRIGCLGCGLKGQVMPGTVSDGYIEWDDGELT
jgi:hypothetical protein